MWKPGIEISVEAGEWASKSVLLGAAERAIGAALAEVAAAFPGEAPEADTVGPAAGQGPELSILFTDDDAMRDLNAGWRGIDKPTNVLAFPQGAEGGLAAISVDSTGIGWLEGGTHAPVLLGDIVLASETVRREAALARMPLEDHIAHLIIHAFLHLLGYDHEAEAEAEEMEQLERAALKRIGIPDPYAAARTQ